MKPNNTLVTLQETCRIYKCKIKMYKNLELNMHYLLRFAAVSDQIMLKAVMQNASIIPDFLYIGAFERTGFNQLQHKLT